MPHIYNNASIKDLRRNLRKNQTDVERNLWNILRNRQMRGLKFIRQYSVGTYILDFFCPAKRLAIELDGGQHNEDSNRAHDEARTQYLALEHIRVVRFWNNEVLENIQGVYDKIEQEIKSNPSQPPLILRGGV